MQDNMLNKAIEIANRAHTGQVDKGNQPYILHPIRVMLATNNELEKICAVLHDVVEDSSFTLDDLRNEGFSEEIIAVVGCLTKRTGESYDDFISRILLNETASRVKLLDLLDNMTLTRIESPTKEDYARILKYIKASDRISDALKPQDAMTSDRIIQVSGCVSVQSTITQDNFLKLFEQFLDSHGWDFDGTADDVTDKE